MPDTLLFHGPESPFGHAILLGRVRFEKFCCKPGRCTLTTRRREVKTNPLSLRRVRALPAAEPASRNGQSGHPPVSLLPLFGTRSCRDRLHSRIPGNDSPWWPSALSIAPAGHPRSGLYPSTSVHWAPVPPKACSGDGDGIPRVIS